MPDSSDPLVLALDTTTRAGSVAVVRGSQTLAVLVGDAARTHGERLPGDLAAALKRAGAAIDEVALYGVAAGPGSFTGLRVGIATVQGLALATGRKVVPVSALEALAASDAARERGERWVAAWMDAQRSQVFAALFADGRQVRPPLALPPEAVLDRWLAEHPDLAAGAPIFIGDGAVRYRDAIARAVPRAIVAEAPPLAPVVARLALARQPQAIAPHAIVPIYVRAPDAELARDRDRVSDPRAPGSS